MGAFVLFVFGLLALGCATDRTAWPGPEVEAARRQADQVVRDSYAEVAALRQDLAATRIAAAKKEAEVQDLRRQIEELSQAAAELRQARTAHLQEIENAQAELALLRDERDRLLQASRGTTGQVADSPSLPRNAGEGEPTATMMQARLAELESAVATLTVELTQVKRELANSPGKRRTGPDTPTGSLSTPPAVIRPTSLTDPPAPSATRPLSVQVHAGDSLWTIARRHGLTVEQLKNANGLQGDLILIGQQLVIP
ncbi:MAG: LysM peptidoglycan-binding domain-containing protein [Nitrospiraceae bacterium]